MIPNVGESLVRRILSDQTLGGYRESVFRSATDDMVPVKIISIVFAEVGSDGSLIVINKDDTHADVDLKDGSVVEFDSISKELDRDVNINDQISRVPGGVTILLVGENSIGELVKTRILWLYGNNCDEVPLAGTGHLGWITVVRSIKTFLSLMSSTIFLLGETSANRRILVSWPRISFVGLSPLYQQ
jgi:hypothetical protein